MMNKIKKGDTVIVVTGKDRGKTGSVLKVFPLAHRLVVEGVNIRKRRERPRSAGKPGQVIEAPTPIASSKVMIKCPSCGRGRRIGHKQEGNKKIRICRKCGHEFKS
ncbi:MAG TPA: 50S ribosomal protein L24 [Candidatus Paceibacterota bacterium]